MLAVLLRYFRSHRRFFWLSDLLPRRQRRLDILGPVAGTSFLRSRPALPQDKNKQANINAIHVMSQVQP